MASGLTKLLTATATALDRRFGWDRLPLPLGVFTLAGLRTRLREENLYDTGAGGAKAGPDGGPHDARTVDGSYNDLGQPAMGMIGARFGRNIPIDRTYPEELPGLLEPNPRLVSRTLLTRDEFKPATIVNVLAGAWLQFEVHDWFSHGKNLPEEPFELELADDDPWAERPMRIERTRNDPFPDGNGRAGDLRHHRLALVGRIADLRQRAGGHERAPRRCGRPDAARPRRPAAARPRREARPHRRRRQLLARARAPAHALHARAQRDRRPAGRRASRLDGRRAVREGAPDHGGADGEDPHRRVDAGDHRAPDDEVRHARELVRDPRQAAGQAELERGARRHPRLARRATTASPTR